MAASSKSSDEVKLESESGNSNTPNTVIGAVTKEEDFGYSFYPDRDKTKQRSLFQRLWYREDANNFKCQVRMRSCISSNPKVKLLVGALESHGCPVDVNRHISCENCLGGVSGGFDSKTMQVVLCQNNMQNIDICCNILAHELLHAFDYCRAKVDFENLRHLACTEIRAANMFHCSLAAAFGAGEASIFNIKERHQLCVKNKALQSVMLVRDVSKQDAMTIVDEVFDKCYNDTEPIGRHCFKNIGRSKRALEEARNYYNFD